MKDNARNHPFLIAFGTLTALYVLTFMPIEQWRFLGFDLKAVTLPFKSAPVASVSAVPSTAPVVYHGTITPYRQVKTAPAGTLIASGAGTTIPVRTSSIPTLASEPALSTTQTVSSLQTPTALSNDLLVDYGNSMQYFRQALKDYSLKEGSPGIVRIAYVGDSMIEGDVITKDLRALLQGRFGGTGAGFLKIIAEDAAFRTDIRHSFSDDWTVQSLSHNSAQGPFWFGPVFISSKGSWVDYEIAGKGAPAYDFFLLYRGDGAAHRISVSINRGPDTSLDLERAEGMHFTKVHDHGGSTLKKIRITFPDPGIKTYGVSFQRETGVYVDNYALRGHKGLELACVSPDVAGQVLRYSPYKLIILQFGVNVAYTQADGFKLYEKGIGGVINHLRQLFPEAGILVVSTTDRCVKDGEAIVSDPGVPDLLEAQHRAAEKEGVAFFDLYHAMGGNGAMNAWVKNGCAVRDYTHISRRGGKKIAELLYGRLMETEYQ